MLSHEENQLHTQVGAGTPIGELLAQGIEPHPATHPELYRVRSAVKILPEGVPFIEGAAEAVLSV
jgi:hypothetical protein